MTNVTAQFFPLPRACCPKFGVNVTPVGIYVTLSCSVNNLKGSHRNLKCSTRCLFYSRRCLFYTSLNIFCLNRCLFYTSLSLFCSHRRLFCLNRRLKVVNRCLKVVNRCLKVVNRCLKVVKRCLFYSNRRLPPEKFYWPAKQYWFKSMVVGTPAKPYYHLFFLTNNQGMRPGRRRMCLARRPGRRG